MTDRSSRTQRNHRLHEKESSRLGTQHVPGKQPQSTQTDITVNMEYGHAKASTPPEKRNKTTQTSSDFKFDEIHENSMNIDIEELTNKITDCKNESAIVDCLKELEALDTEKFALTAENINKILKEKNGESLLHLALKSTETLKCVEKIIENNPNILMEKRKNDKHYQGQTPLHVAIVNGNIKAVKLFLEKSEKTAQELLCEPAIGTKFKNTVLMGQLPLSVAALACRNENFEMMEYLLHKNAKIGNTNEDGDTVFHSLIKYADVDPEKMQHIKPTFEYLWKFIEEDFCGAEIPKPTDFLFWENKDGYTILHLSAKLGVSELFDFIINITGVYRFKNIKDGLFDIREYDVTEFDRLIQYQHCQGNVKKITILESLFDTECTEKEAFQILNHELVNNILKVKWKAYNCVLVSWMILHFIFMLLFTISSIGKSQLLFCKHSNDTLCDIGEIFYGVVCMNVGFGTIYFTFAFLCIMKFFLRSKFMCHNIDYISCLLITAIGALLEIFFIVLKMHQDFHLVPALISGWYFMLYFAPLWKSLVSFTYMIKSGFLEDFVPFAVVFIWLLIAFTSIMYILFRGTDDVDEFDTIESSLFTMLNLGVGLDNIGVLHQSRIPWLAYTIFVVFAILSFIHLFNALVAVMSTTFGAVHQDKNSYLKYNKLRMIELFEDIVLISGLVKCNWLCFIKKAELWTRSDTISPSAIYDKYTKQIANKTVDKQLEYGTRYFSDLHLLVDLEDFKDDKIDKKMKVKDRMKTVSTNLMKLIKSEKIKPENPPQPREIHPEKEITYVRVFKSNNKASQFPEVYT